MPKAIKVGVITQAEGAHLADYFGALARIEEAEAVALADPSEKAVADEGLHVLKSIFAFYEAARTGRTQVVD